MTAHATAIACADGTMPVRQAFLLAAGLGVRMRPLTDAVPKALLSLRGKTLLDHMLDHFAAACVTRTVVNVHWHAAQVGAAVAARAGKPHVVLREEPELLDTGGAVALALQSGVLHSNEPFFVANCDSVWLDGPSPALARLARALDPQAWAVILLHRTFLVQGEVGAGDFFLDPVGMPRRRGEREIAPYLYAGLALVRPELFEGAPAGAFSMNWAWDSALRTGRLRAVVHDGLWFHLSQPDDVAEAEAALAAQFTWATT